MKKLLCALLALVISGCADVPLAFWIEPTLTTEQRLVAYSVISTWNDRVGINGRRSSIVDQPDDANRKIGVRQRDWLVDNVGPFASGAFVPADGTVVVIAGTTMDGFRRILDHEVGHSLGLMAHLPRGTNGLMDESATEDFGPNDLAYCRDVGVCR